MAGILHDSGLDLYAEKGRKPRLRPRFVIYFDWDGSSRDGEYIPMEMGPGERDPPAGRKEKVVTIYPAETGCMKEFREAVDKACQHLTVGTINVNRVREFRDFLEFYPREEGGRDFFLCYDGGRNSPHGKPVDE